MDFFLCELSEARICVDSAKTIKELKGSMLGKLKDSVLGHLSSQMADIATEDPRTVRVPERPGAGGIKRGRLPEMLQMNSRLQ